MIADSCFTRFTAVQIEKHVFVALPDLLGGLQHGDRHFITEALLQAEGPEWGAGNYSTYSATLTCIFPRFIDKPRSKSTIFPLI